MTMYAAAAVALPVVFSGTVGVGEPVLILDGPGSVGVLVLDSTGGGMPVESVRGQNTLFQQVYYTIVMYTCSYNPST